MPSSRWLATVVAMMLAMGSEARVSAAPALITVTTTLPGITPDGLCSLAEAIENANAAGSIHADCAAGGSPTTIALSPASTYTLLTAHGVADDRVGLPAVTGIVTIEGQGAVVERSTAADTPAFRLMVVTAAGSLTINDLTLRNGFANPDGTGLGGGAILNRGTLALASTTLSNNRSGTQGGALTNASGAVTISGGAIRDNIAALAGGGVWNRGGQASLADTLVSGNQSTGSANDFARGGGLANHATTADAAATLTRCVVTGNVSNGVGGGGLDNAAAGGRTARMTLIETSVTDNRAVGTTHVQGLGGGIQNSFFRAVTSATATLALERSVVRGNAAVNGGGISSGFDLAGSQVLALHVANSEVSGNTASGDGFQVGNGGGIYVVNGTTTLANTTVSGNIATGTGTFSGRGGGVMNAGLSGRLAHLTGLNVTIASNQASDGGGGLANDPFNGSATVELANTLIGSNPAPGDSACVNVGGVLTSLGHNLDAGSSCPLTDPTDLVATDPQLGTLLANGGPTRTHALLPGSPAIDAGDDAVCAALPVGGTDQRGIARPQGSACDVGAYESDRAATALALDTAFRSSDGTSGTGRFTLLVDGTFVDQAGFGGVWNRPAPGEVRMQYAAGAACSGVWAGRFTSSTEVSGVHRCLDGSGVRGEWRATVAGAP